MHFENMFYVNNDWIFWGLFASCYSSFFFHYINRRPLRKAYHWFEVFAQSGKEVRCTKFPIFKQCDEFFAENWKSLWDIFFYYQTQLLYCDIIFLDIWKLTGNSAEIQYEVWGNFELAWRVWKISENHLFFHLFSRHIYRNANVSISVHFINS